MKKSHLFQRVSLKRPKNCMKAPNLFNVMISTRWAAPKIVFGT